MRITTVSSGLITTQALTSGGESPRRPARRPPREGHVEAEAEAPGGGDRAGDEGTAGRAAVP